MSNESKAFRQGAVLLLGLLLGLGVGGKSDHELTGVSTLEIGGDRAVATASHFSTPWKQIEAGPQAATLNPQISTLSSEELGKVPKGVLNRHVHDRLQNLYSGLRKRMRSPETALEQEKHDRLFAGAKEKIADYELRGTFAYEVPRGHVTVELFKQSLANPDDENLKGLSREERLDFHQCLPFDLEFRLTDPMTGETLRTHRARNHTCLGLGERDGKFTTTMFIETPETPFFGHFFSYEIPDLDFVSAVEVVPDHQNHKPIVGKFVWIVKEYREIAE